MDRILSAAGFVLRLIGTPIAAHPTASILLALVGGLAAAVAGNAFYAQPGQHPRPMMATRTNAAAAGPAASDEVFDERGLLPVPLVLEVQTALRATGHYRAALDGKPGSGTAAAIRAFQAEHGYRVDGEASPKLLAAIRKAEAQSEAPGGMEGEERVASVKDVIEAGGFPPDGATEPDATGSVARAGPQDLVRRIQSGLAAAEVADLTADGVLGERTRSAIRAFEALEGLDVTGEPSPRILARLIEIGAAE